MSDYTEAIERLELYNSGDYDVVDNPYGFDGNGHQQNFVQALNDVATIFAITPPTGYLTDSTMFYVRPGGLDDTDRLGLVDDDDNAFATPEFAADTIRSLYNFNDFPVTLKIADGTYAASGAPVLTVDPWIGNGSFNIVGNVTTPANVIFSSTSADCFRIASASGDVISSVTVDGIEVRSTTSGYGINNQGTCHLSLGPKMRYGACVNGHIAVTWRTAQIHVTGGYTISGGANLHIECDAGIIQFNSGTNTLSGTPAFASAFARFRNHGCLISDATWSGAGTGKRFSGEGNSLCNVGAADQDHFPGNSAGTCISGAVYESADTRTGVARVEFPSSQSASTNANTLDDYEEGTFTPAITIAGSATTSSAAEGTYTKIGQMVRFRLRVALTSNGAGSGAAVITGLPFSATGNTALSAHVAVTDAARSWSPITSGTTINLRYAAASVTTATETEVIDTFDCSIAGSYTV